MKSRLLIILITVLTVLIAVYEAGCDKGGNDSASKNESKTEKSSDPIEITEELIDKLDKMPFSNYQLDNYNALSFHSHEGVYILMTPLDMTDSELVVLFYIHKNHALKVRDEYRKILVFQNHWMLDVQLTADGGLYLIDSDGNNIFYCRRNQAQKIRESTEIAVISSQSDVSNKMLWSLLYKLHKDLAYLYVE